MNNVLKRMELLRIEKNVKAKDICEYLDIEPNTYSSWKARNRTPSAELIGKIAEYFGVTCDYLILGIDMPIDREEHDLLFAYNK